MEWYTLQIADFFQRIQFFEFAGHAVSSRVATVPSWWHAIELCDTPQWQKVKLEARNHLTSTLYTINKQRYNKWNQIGEEIHKTVIDIVQKQTKPILEVEYLPSSTAFVSAIDWDVFNILMSTEYSDLDIPTFYAELALWYVKGHFPCGWEGNYPEGRMIVY